MTAGPVPTFPFQSWTTPDAPTPKYPPTIAELMTRAATADDAGLLGILQADDMPVGVKCHAIDRAGEAGRKQILFMALDHKAEMVAARAADWLTGMVADEEVRDHLEQAREHSQFGSVQKIAEWALEE